jgi:hypothetical protein
MKEWKLNVFVNAVKARMERENRPAEDIVAEYVRLTDEERNDILQKAGE